VNCKTLRNQSSLAQPAAPRNEYTCGFFNELGCVSSFGISFARVKRFNATL
jgi:hypothetical protein